MTKYSREIFDRGTDKILTHLYSLIFYVSASYVQTMVEKENISREEAEKAFEILRNQSLKNGAEKYHSDPDKDKYLKILYEQRHYYMDSQYF